MRRLTTIEIGALALGLVFVVVGTCMIARPNEGFLLHPGPGRDRAGGPLPPNEPEYVSKERCRIYGGTAVVLGVGIGSLALYRGKK